MRRPCRSSASASPPVRTGESGSAYIVVLLVLVVLTILGLSLALVTSTERQIGASEKTVQRLLATAESGYNLAVAKKMVLKDDDPMVLQFREPRARVDGSADPRLANAALLLRHEVTVSTLMPLLDMPCHLCEINSGGMTDLSYKAINHGVVSAATRRGWVSSDDPAEATVFGQQRITGMVQIQPIAGDDDAVYHSDKGEASESSSAQKIGDHPF